MREQEIEISATLWALWFRKDLAGIITVEQRPPKSKEFSECSYGIFTSRISSPQQVNYEV